MTSQKSFLEIRKVIFTLPVWQLLIGLVVGVIFWFLSGPKAAIAAFYGGSIGFAGSLVFAFVMFGFGSPQSKDVMRNMFRAEAFKILTVGMMFYFAFAVLALPFMPVIVGFMVTLIVFFVALITVFK
jgi:F0F1-type ATP synthase assembly protein I